MQHHCSILQLHQEKSCILRKKDQKLLVNTDELKQAIASHGKNQSQIAAELGFHRSKMSRLVNGSTIDESDSKLLNLYFFGVMPFDLLAPTRDLQNLLHFTATEWRVITILAHRQGFISPKAWITTQIRAYLDHSEHAEEARKDDLKKSAGRGSNLRATRTRETLEELKAPLSKQSSPPPRSQT
jgi:transcriptional regulator with XRE-family HTH domain